MTAPTEPEPVEAEDLQFDQAEYSAPAATAVSCSACHRPIADTYYQANQSVVCGGCREAILARFQGGSGFGRFLRAVFFGSLAGLAGAALYYAVRAITGLEVGLISILVGILVGSAVKTGSRQRGGWLYQGLAVFITYTAIVSTYLPDIWTEFAKAAEKQEANQKAPAAPKPPVVAKAPSGPKTAVPGATGQKPAVPPKAEPEPGLEKIGVGQALLGLGILMAIMMAIAYAAPIVMSFQSPIVALIVGIGLWEAWKLNKKVRLVFNGPFHVGRDHATEEAAADA